jgi:hypothetical protein
MAGRIEIQEVQLDRSVSKLGGEKEGNRQRQGQHRSAMVQEKAEVGCHPSAREHGCRLPSIGAGAWLESFRESLSLGLWDKPPLHGIRARRHCERSEAILAQKQRLLRRLALLAMTGSSPLLLWLPRVLSHGPYFRVIKPKYIGAGKAKLSDLAPVYFGHVWAPSTGANSSRVTGRRM